ncbi:MAG: hypothetical protein COV07_01685 [Candidatus Vogelbacteria bacterium CG10_big_fil_rev_8_21_14_0_10_45_14]|uniref:AI-2E family transporter n=1 Tax=Candidatus Vogelbacteria bacterium CG10_big_fil_rev_8_21_14_0_10_45_14 TaxID=1975042 RepID=A0A2H0RKF8_9BACT|nr:MAG: hypothetical protein COV07_01685 [Candidatus Vogelbacteria bacterium CG10_big_fil_rev_8_21_14_0_10_45_14]
MQENGAKLRYSVSTGTMIRAVLVVVAFLLLWYLRDILLSVLTAIVVASAAQPFANWFMKRLRFPRVLSVIVVYLVLISVFGFLLYAFIPPVADEIVRFTATLPERIENLSLISEKFGGSLAGERLSSIITEKLQNSDLVGSLGAFFSGAGGNVAGTAGALFGGFFTFTLIVVLSFYFAVQEKGIENFLRLVVPSSHEDYAVSLWQRSQKKIGLWMQGQLLLALIIGIFVYLGLSIFGVPYALLLAILAAVMELIPIFGPIIAAVPAVLLAFTMSSTVGLAMIAFYVIIQQFENHLIYPLVVRKIVGVPPLLVIIALIVGSQLAGFIGIILAVPLAAALMELIEDMETQKDLDRKSPHAEA